jgi:hypothetical protein
VAGGVVVVGLTVVVGATVVVVGATVALVGATDVVVTGGLEVVGAGVVVAVELQAGNTIISTSTTTRGISHFFIVCLL